MTDWKYKVDLSDLWDEYDEGTKSVTDVAEEVYSRVYKVVPMTDELELILCDIQDAQTLDELNNHMHDLWDWADTNKVWIGVI